MQTGRSLKCSNGQTTWELILHNTHAYATYKSIIHTAPGLLCSLHDHNGTPTTILGVRHVQVYVLQTVIFGTLLQPNFILSSRKQTELSQPSNVLAGGVEKAYFAFL